MSRQQFAFVVGFLVAAMWAAVGFLATLAAVVGGVIGLVVVRVLDGDTDLSDLTGRFAGDRR